MSISWKYISNLIIYNVFTKTPMWFSLVNQTQKYAVKVENSHQYYLITMLCYQKEISRLKVYTSLGRCSICTSRKQLQTINLHDTITKRTMACIRFKKQASCTISTRSSQCHTRQTSSITH